MSNSADRGRALELADRLRALGSVSITPFFSGVGIRLDGIQFAFVIGGVLYFRVNDRSRSEYETLGALPFQYMGNKKQVTVGSYYELPDEIVDDPDAIRLWAMKAREAAWAGKSRSQRRSVRRSTAS